MSHDVAPFAILPRTVLDAVRDGEIQPSAVVVYSALALRADNDTGECFPSHSKIAADTGTSVRTVKRALGQLIDAGLIERVQRRTPAGDHTSNLYTLPFAINRRATPPNKGGRVTHDPTLGSPMTPPGDTDGLLTRPSELDPLNAASDSSNQDQTWNDPNLYPEGFHAWAVERCAQKSGGPGLLRTILRNDQGAWRDELQAAKANRTPTPTAKPPAEPITPENCPHPADRTASVDDCRICAACGTELTATTKGTP